MKKIILLFLIPCFLFSETAILRDGIVIKGKLKSQDVEKIVMIVKGKETVVSKTKLRRFIYAITPEQEEKQTREELAKMKSEKASKTVKTKEEEQEEERLIEEEIAKALAERDKQERLNLSFEERIKRLESEVIDLKANNNLADSGSRLNKLEEEIKDLKTRTRRMERFLEIDPDLEEYYSKPRTPWSIIWRSALIPGWGLSYGRSSFGTVYTSLFFISALGVAGIRESVNTLEEKFTDKIINDYVLQPFFVRQAVANTTQTSSTSTSSFDNLLNLNSNIKLYNLYKLQRDIEDQEKATDNLVNGVAGLYALQLFHSAVYSYFWAKKVPDKFDSKTETTSFRIQITPRVNPLTTQTQADLQASVQFRF
jgi:hypothetical protein